MSRFGPQCASLFGIFAVYFTLGHQMIDFEDLPSSIAEQIDSLSKEGNALANSRHFKEAYSKYQEAYQLIPKPQLDYSAATWLLASMGDVCFLGNQIQVAHELLSHAVMSVGGLGNPFIHLRLGQCAFELGNLDSAANELCRAYMGAGKDIFEEDDEKYFAFLRTRIDPPASGIW